MLGVATANREGGRVPLRPVFWSARVAMGRGKVGIVAPIPRYVSARLSALTDSVIVDSASQSIVGIAPVSVRRWQERTKN